MDSLGLALRVGLSLACVLGLVWLLSKGMLKTAPGRGANRDRVKVIARQPLSRVSSVAVVQVGERALVLGVTEQHVTLLTEAELDALVVPLPQPDPGTLPTQRRPDGRTPDNLPSQGGPDSRTPDNLPPQRGPDSRTSDNLPSQGGPDSRTPGSLPKGAGPLAGSALSPATWSQAVDALRERTVRR